MKVLVHFLLRQFVAQPGGLHHLYQDFTVLFDPEG